ncbi:methyltransferase domain-containing protein [Oculatella sp. LEGE 06141]|uniref:class I SAM-dependent methyltransferase n=1 Tax=Oculatella sp. LEGE 06141 TaxID=1828648 RepID=UPI00187FFF3F|nr:class I SAM-dependent methyltransferase [Oculatella sp. LEGE 06141]MBE9177304.1 methyltransferase domain-containing protein [Oculatella sp. LEGE 06141]
MEQRPATDDRNLSAPTSWNPELYDRHHAFVSQLGADVLALLAPAAGEHILDLGCGTGHLAHQIAVCGAIVTAVDASAEMIEQARTHYPNLHFEVADATRLSFASEFDAVFSNAVLHWIRDPEAAIASIWQALKPGGRFVAEFGGKGNVQLITDAMSQAMSQTVAIAAHPAPVAESWYFPSIGEYTTLLEQHGFDVRFAALFDRPTPLDGEQGLQHWVRMFGDRFLRTIPAEQQATLLTEIETRTRSRLYRNGTWFADYRRIRVVAFKA